MTHFSFFDEEPDEPGFCDECGQPLSSDTEMWCDACAAELDEADRAAEEKEQDEARDGGLVA